MADETTTQEQTAAEQAAPQTQGPDLSVTDLLNIRSILDVAASRGAFKAAEMTAVGTVYNKLDTFLKAVAPATPAQEGTQPQG